MFSFARNSRVTPTARSNANVYAYDCDGIVLGPYPLLPTNSVTSPNLANARMAGGFGLSWESVPGQQYTVDVSTNLPYFVPLTNIDAMTTQSVFIDPIDTNTGGSQFFRLRVPN